MILGMPMINDVHNVLPPPLRGRVGEGGNLTVCVLCFTALPALRADLPRKGGGTNKQFGSAVLEYCEAHA